MTFSQISTKCSQSFSGYTLRLIAPFIPCVPVRLPLGAASWQLSPLWHGGNNSRSILDQKSVGFIRVSPYLQYVVVYLGIPRIHHIFRNPPRGFSIIKIFGSNSFIILSTFWSVSSHCFAYSLIGSKFPVIGFFSDDD